MFSLTPWKKKDGNLMVARDEPLGLTADRFAPWGDEFGSLMAKLFQDRWMRNEFGQEMSDWFDRAGFNDIGEMGWDDRDDEYVLHADLPGFEPDDFEVRLSGNLLTLRAEHKEEEREKDVVSSYRYGSFSRTMTVPRGVDDTNVRARYHSGVLEIHLPKTEVAESKRIEVKAT